MMHHVLFVMNRINTMNTEQKKNNELVKYSDQAWTRLVNKTSVDEQADFVFVQNTEKTIRLIRTNFDIQHWKHWTRKLWVALANELCFVFFYSFFLLLNSMKDNEFTWR